MSEQEFEHFLAIAVEGYADAMGAPMTNISTFREAGVLTNNRGLVVRIGDAEFQVTIVREPGAADRTAVVWPRCDAGCGSRRRATWRAAAQLPTNGLTAAHFAERRSRTTSPTTGLPVRASGRSRFRHGRPWCDQFEQELARLSFRAGRGHLLSISLSRISRS